MDLLNPETGTLVWMLLAVGIVFFIIIKWGFPMITGMVEKRNGYIDESLLAAKAANEKLAGIRQECDGLLKEARDEQARIIREATERRDAIVADAELKARESAGKIVAEAREQIQMEREEALRSLRRQVAEISLEVSEKVLLKELSDRESQMEMIERLVDEVESVEKA